MNWTTSDDRWPRIAGRGRKQPCLRDKVTVTIKNAPQNDFEQKLQISTYKEIDEMKKSILLLSGAGIAAGAAIALAATKKKSTRGNASADGASTNGGLNAEDRQTPAESSETRTSDEGRASSMKNLRSEHPGEPEEPEIDDQGTDQESASAILTRVRDAAFDSSDEKLGLALGRPTEEVTGWLNGSEVIDGDVLLKARALAMQRGVSVP